LFAAVFDKKKSENRKNLPKQGKNGAFWEKVCLGWMMIRQTAFENVFSVTRRKVV